MPKRRRRGGVNARTKEDLGNLKTLSNDARKVDTPSTFSTSASVMNISAESPTDPESEDEACNTWICVVETPEIIPPTYLLGKPWSLRRIDGLLIPRKISFGDFLERLRHSFDTYFQRIENSSPPFKKFKRVRADVSSWQTLHHDEQPQQIGVDRCHRASCPTTALLAFSVDVIAMTPQSQHPRSESDGHDRTGGAPDPQDSSVPGRCAEFAEELLGQVPRTPRVHIPAQPKPLLSRATPPPALRPPSQQIRAGPDPQPPRRRLGSTGPGERGTGLRQPTT